MSVHNRSPLDDDIVTEEVPVNPVVQIAEAALPTQSGSFRVAVFQVEGAEIVALLHGDHTAADTPVVRLHSECLTGDVLGSLRCDCGEQLQAALEQIAREQYGILLYLRQEGRGIGLANKIRAYALQDRGLDTVDANLALGLPVDGRDYSVAASVLRFLGVRKVRLLTNNPAKCSALEALGITVDQRIPLLVAPNPANLGYLRTKARRMGHVLSPPGRDEQEEPET
jgi:GTP cyclohydrolase II